MVSFHLPCCILVALLASNHAALALDFDPQKRAELPRPGPPYSSFGEQVVDVDLFDSNEHYIGRFSERSQFDDLNNNDDDDNYEKQQPSSRFFTNPNKEWMLTFSSATTATSKGTNGNEVEDALTIAWTARHWERVENTDGAQFVLQKQVWVEKQLRIGVPVVLLTFSAVLMAVSVAIEVYQWSSSHAD